MPRAARCALCGVSSTLPELFQHGRVSQNRSGPICPRCFAERQASYYKWFIEAMCLVVVLGALLWGKGLEPLGCIVISLACGFFFTVILTPLHELAHALAAVALGLPVYWISIGWYGKPLFKFRLGRCVIEVTRIPLGGLTYAAHRSPRFIRLKHFLFIAAGPLLHCVLLVVAWRIVVGAEQSQRLPGWMIWLVVVFGLANAFEIVINLWPRRFKMPLGELCNDGLAMLTLPFASQAEIDAYPVAYYYYESLARMRQDEHAGSLECCLEGLRRYPDNASLRSCHALVLLDHEQCDEAARIFEELRQQPDLPPESDALLLNCIAWADLVSWNPEKLESADKCSAQAIEALPWVPAIKGTRGSVLLTSGKVDDGIYLLEQAWAENEDPSNQALNAAFLALGAARLGRHEEARNWLRQAGKLDPGCRQLDRIRHELDERIEPEE